MLLTQDRMSFLKNCRALLKNRGISGITSACGNDGPGLTYEDEIIYISEFDDGSFMEVERKASNTPVLYIHDRVVILFSGEFYFLENHVEALLTIDI